MDILQRKDATRSFGKPIDWDTENQGECEVLDVVDVPDATGANWMVSHWKPTPAELAALMANGTIELWVNGTAHPAVAVAVVGVRD